MRTLQAALSAFVISIAFVSPALATFSIVACERETGRCGVAVATHNLAVGQAVPFAQAGVGAGVSQFETNPGHRSVILEALLAGSSAAEALKRALSREGDFQDGADVSYRQIGVVAFHDGSSAAHTGRAANGYAADQSKAFVTVQGNGLVSEDVLVSMLSTFDATSGSLAERLMSALEAGFREGGQTTGVTSAALLVSTPEGWPIDTDFRVDFAPGTAVEDLREAFNAGVARQRLFQARRAFRTEDNALGESLVDEALLRAPSWDRIWLSAAQIAQEQNQPDLVQERYCQFQELNPVWAEMLADDFGNVKCVDGEPAR